MAIEIELSKGQIAIVDDIDADLAESKWHTKKYDDNLVYAQRGIKKPTGGWTTQQMHRLILERKLGHPIPKGLVVDHIDSCGLNNRRENLRLATPAQNARNCRQPRNNGSGFKGVSWNANMGMWMAGISIDHKSEFLGYFATPEEAFIVYCERAIEEYGEFARFDHEQYEACKQMYPNPPQSPCKPRLTKEQVSQIESMLLDGHKQVDIATKFGISQSKVSVIKLRAMQAAQS